MAVFKIFVEKKPEYAVEASGVLSDIKTVLQIKALKKVRVINRYYVEGISEDVFNKCINTIFSEPQVDNAYSELNIKSNEKVFASEFLPGQFDQRADSCEQCIQIATQGVRPRVRTAKIFVLEGDISDLDFEKIKSYLINPVESRLATFNTPETLKAEYSIPTTVETINGFTEMTQDELAVFINDYRLAMDKDDVVFCQEYFKNIEKRNPTITEIRLIDTYWSDHCRHTTFLTNIDNVTIDTKLEKVSKTYGRYLEIRKELYQNKNKPITLMDVATIAAKKLKKDGYLSKLDESEEINACSVKIKVKINGTDEDYLLMFKNETHNHPTEIEPFGGAATCLGGAIRDPLSGRSYVYQAMRVTGAADPLCDISKTIEGKLPQRKITLGAAAGYSSYGNQIGLATGLVNEIYHPGYVAKRMEIGAVIGAAKAENVIRQEPEPSDVIILLGGKTGRDGCGGATGSSKSHTLESLEACGAEVQKGNPPEERKIQRLFRNPLATKMIKRCNDFGAGGVSVAIGELADGLLINLDNVSKKYEGLDGTELAISESQERMAVVVSRDDADSFIKLAESENLEASVVATVTETPRLKMTWNDNVIVDLSREFLNSNGATKHTDIEIIDYSENCQQEKDTMPVDEKWLSVISDLNICSQKGLVERFDSTIGAGTVLMPFGGKYQLSPSQAMVAKIPVSDGETSTCSCMAYGFNPFISEKSPYNGALLAVVEAVSKIVACGGSYKECYMSFQEYFERTNNDKRRWGKPLAALLGALQAQLSLNIAAIGGKDSMSGTFEEIDVPPTLVSFAVSVTDANKVVSTDFKSPSSKVILILPQYDKEGIPDFESVKSVFDKVEALIEQGIAKSVYTLTSGGICEAITKMCFGNRIGFIVDDSISKDMLFKYLYGGFIVEVEMDYCTNEIVLGTTTASEDITFCGKTISLNILQKTWENKLEPVFASNIEHPSAKVPKFSYHSDVIISSKEKFAHPRVLIPVFPGTNCEYDSAKVFEKAGATVETFVIKNLSQSAIEDSVKQFAKLIEMSQIIMLPGGFSGGDEPDGSGKFITSFLRNPLIKEKVNELLHNRDGLILGICNGFQALIKLGLVPFGEIIDTDESCPTLTYNLIGRHQSKMVDTIISSNKSPWLNHCNVGDIHTVPISHGEGRFVASEEMVKSLAENGQIATQYVDKDQNPTMDICYNPNASMCAIEGITSPDGRVFGKMAHSERIGDQICKNVYGVKDQGIFKSGVDYFK